MKITPRKLTKKMMAGYNILAAHVYNKRTPLSVSFRVTFRCNLTCPYCQVWKSAKADQELTTDQYLNIIDELAKLGTQIVSFTDLSFSSFETIMKLTGFVECEGFGSPFP